MPPNTVPYRYILFMSACMYCVCVYIVMCNHYSTYGTYVYALWTGGLVLWHCIQCCMEHSSYLTYILTNKWRRPPLKKILTLILQHQLHLHTPNLWRTVVHVCVCLCLCMGGWYMSVQVWVLALSIKMCLHTHTTGTVSSVARTLNKPQHATCDSHDFIVNFLSSHSLAACSM